MEPSSASRSGPEGVGPGPVAGGGDTPRMRSVGFLLSQLGWGTAARFRDTIAPLGLEPREFAILRALASAEGQSQTAVCHALSIPPSRMVGHVDALETRGLVERHLNAADRRARAIHVTASGHQLLNQAAELLMRYEQWVCQPLEPQERELLLGLLIRLADHYALPAIIHPDLTTAHAQPWPGTPATPERTLPNP